MHILLATKSLITVCFFGGGCVVVEVFQIKCRNEKKSDLQRILISVFYVIKARIFTCTYMYTQYICSVKNFIFLFIPQFNSFQFSEYNSFKLYTYTECSDRHSDKCCDNLFVSLQGKPFAMYIQIWLGIAIKLNQNLLF